MDVYETVVENFVPKAFGGDLNKFDKELSNYIQVCEELAKLLKGFNFNPEFNIVSLYLSSKLVDYAFAFNSYLTFYPRYNPISLVPEEGTYMLKYANNCLFVWRYWKNEHRIDSYFELKYRHRYVRLYEKKNIHYTLENDGSIYSAFHNNITFSDVLDEYLESKVWPLNSLIRRLNIRIERLRPQSEE